MQECAERSTTTKGGVDVSAGGRNVELDVWRVTTTCLPGSEGKRGQAQTPRAAEKPPGNGESQGLAGCCGGFSAFHQLEASLYTPCDTETPRRQLPASYYILRSLLLHYTYALLHAYSPLPGFPPAELSRGPSLITPGRH